MSLTELVVSQAKFMAREMTSRDLQLLEAVCQAAVSSLEARLRDNLTTDDCQADFVTAAGMYALAALSDIGDFTGVEQLTAGDVTVRRGHNGAANYLRSQADLLMAPYLKSGFVFLGV